MMTSSPESIAEAKRALREYMERERNTPQSIPDSPQSIFEAKGNTDTDLVTDANIEQIKSEARESARRYAESRSKNVRQARQIDETNAAAVEGRDSALAVIEKRRRSVI